MSILGGWKFKAESRLTVKKEDTSLYHFVRSFNDRVCTPEVKRCHFCFFLQGSTSGTEKIYVLTFLSSRDAQERQRGQTGRERRCSAARIPPSVTLTWTGMSRATWTNSNICTKELNHSLIWAFKSMESNIRIILLIYVGAN